jgi:hypothetical protein
MQSSETIGIGLPLKILVWQDEAWQHLCFLQRSSWLATRHGLGDDVQAPIGRNECPPIFWAPALGLGLNRGAEMRF